MTLGPWLRHYWWSVASLLIGVGIALVGFEPAVTTLNPFWVMICCVGVVIVVLGVAHLTTTPNSSRSYKLLMSHLTIQQRYELRFYGTFGVVGSDGSRYRIGSQKSFGVHSEGRTYCAYPRGVPLYDVMLAQKLLLETNATGFKNVAYWRKSSM